MLADQFSKSSDSFSQYKERVSSLSSDFELGLFFFLIRKNLFWIFLFFTISFACAYLYLRYTPQVFQSKTILQINSENEASKILNVQNINEEGQNGIAKSLEFLRSKVFFVRALSSLPLKTTYFAEGTFRKNEHYNNSSYSAEATIKHNVIYGQRVYIHFDNKNNGEINYNTEGKDHSYKFLVGNWLSTPEMDIKIIVSDFSQIESQQSAVKENTLYFVINNFDMLADEYFSRLNVRVISEAAKTIEISFQDNNAVKTADVVTAMADQFIDYDVEKKGESAQKILSFLDEQLSIVYDRLKNAETLIYTFKKDNKVSDTKNMAEVGTARLNTMEDELIGLELKENVLAEIEKSIDEKKDIDSYHFISLLSGVDFESTLTAQIASLQNLLKEKEELLYEVTPTSEKIKSKEFQIGVQKKLLLESIRSIKEKLAVRRENLDKKVKELEAQFYSMPSEEVEYSRLQRLFSINEKFYNLLLEKKTEYSISQAGNVSKHIVLDKAITPTIPISPQKTMVLIAAILSALLISLLLIFARYITHNEINSVNDINKLTNAAISVLGIVPKYKKDIPVSQLLVDKNPKSLIAEAFRSIRTNLQFISNDPGPKTAAVTSTISGEGKTFVAINLAGIIAYSGKKVIVIDLDMRKPKIHLGFGAENTKGMSTMLIGRDALDDCIQHSSFENLDFITAGPIPPNPSELIISKKMDEMIAYLKTKYDFIVLDTPPVGLVTDGVAVIQKVDYPLYIFRSEYSKRNFIQNLDRLYNENHIKKISAILNGVDIDRKSYGYNYGYGHGYGYGYGQGYGYYEDRAGKQMKKSFFKRFVS
ncbi:MAG: polysaccharide biosynthesis tyrosine autokinase [Bacteroidetes bacterium]|nr:polysaccharide biosynthesis tyrosine autokinase [Bacteroidota bacterium]